MSAEKNAKVLIVDDSESMRVIAAAIVQKLGYSVCGVAANGEEAVSLALRDKPDIVLLDIVMPLKNGIEALKEIKAGHPDAIVVMMTQMADSNLVEECLEAGAANYILKSATHEEIAQSIKEAWEADKA